MFVKEKLPEAPDSKKKSLPFPESLKITQEIFSEDITSNWYRNHCIQQPQPEVFMKSSEKMDDIESEPIGCCITSPPYLNNFDYAEMTRLQLHLLGWAHSWGDITEKIRNNLITNTIGFYKKN
ncbi:MAG: hypothetical protein GY754_05120 [bacterium]|nr:hypothetical protein [bacterium]